MKKSVEKLIRAQDWIYENGSASWQDGLLLGNGELGSMANAPAHLEWVFNHINVFDPTLEQGMLDARLPHREVCRRIEKMPYRNTLFLNQAEEAPKERGAIRPTISAAVLRLRFWHGIGWSAPSIPRTVQHLHLFEGILEEKMKAHNFQARSRMFIPREGSVFCMRIRAGEDGSGSGGVHIFELIRPSNRLLEEPRWFRDEENKVYGFTQKLPGKKESYAVVLKYAEENPSSGCRWSSTDSNSCEILQNGNTDFFLSVKSSFDYADPLEAAVAEVNLASRKGFDLLEKEHKEWFRAWWERSYADFGKYKEIQKYYTFSLYEIASSFKRGPMPGLNGLCYGPLSEQTPGVIYQSYTHDQNAQIPSLAFFPSNHVEQIKALTETYLAVKKTLKRETRKLFGCDGIFLPLTMNQRGMEYPTRSYRYTLCGSAYTGMVISLAWKYSQDMELLKDHIYPLLRELVIFHQGILSRDEKGTYHLDWSVPPEIFTLTRDECAMTAMFKVALETAIETSALLGRDAAKRKEWSEILAHYPPIPKTPEGAFWCGPDVPLDHYFYGGHICYPFFPSGADTDVDAARKTLELIDNFAAERSYADFNDQWHPNHEWSMFLLSSMRIRCGDRKEGWHGLERFLELFGKENGLFAHDPILIGPVKESEENAKRNAFKLETNRKYCDGSVLTGNNPEVPHPICVTENPNAKRLAPAVLEGSSSFLFMATETLLQSHTGKLVLFPAVPEDFTGSFETFLAQGGYEVSAVMKKGVVRSFRVYSRTGGTRAVLLPDGRQIPVTLRKGESFTWKA